MMWLKQKWRFNRPPLLGLFLSRLPCKRETNIQMKWKWWNMHDTTVRFAQTHFLSIHMFKLLISHRYFRIAIVSTKQLQAQIKKKYCVVVVIICLLPFVLFVCVNVFCSVIYKIFYFFLINSKENLIGPSLLLYSAT